MLKKKIERNVFMTNVKKILNFIAQTMRNIFVKNIGMNSIIQAMKNLIISANRIKTI
jgi:hypothetical protein